MLRVIILSGILVVACKWSRSNRGNYGVAVRYDGEEFSAHPPSAPCSRYPCSLKRKTGVSCRSTGGVGEREREGVSFKLEIASSVAMMGRKLGAKQNAKEERRRRLSSRECGGERFRSDKGKKETGSDERARRNKEGCINGKGYIDFFIYASVYLSTSEI